VVFLFYSKKFKLIKRINVSIGGYQEMRNKILIGSLFAVILLVCLPSISALNDSVVAESNNITKLNITDKKNSRDSSIWTLIDIYIDMMYHLRLFRVEVWNLIANLPGVGGTILSLINLRAYLLSTRATVSRDVLNNIINVLKDIIPLNN
jgi:hypothetical protein